MRIRRREHHGIHDVDHPHGQLGDVTLEKPGGGQGLLGGNIPGTGKDDVRFYSDG